MFEYECPGCGQVVKTNDMRSFWLDAQAQAGSPSRRRKKRLLDGRCEICGSIVPESPEDDWDDDEGRRDAFEDEEGRPPDPPAVVLPAERAPRDDAAPPDRPKVREPSSAPPKVLGLGAFHWLLIGVGVAVAGLLGIAILAVVLVSSRSRPVAGPVPPPALQPPAPQPPPAQGGPAQQQPPPTAKFPGLLAYWSFDEGTGTRAADSSGNALHATLVEAGWTDGIRGKALHLRGPGSYLDYGSSPRLSFAAAAPFTIAFWTKTARAQGTLLSQRHGSDGSPVLDVLFQQGRVQAQFRPDGNELAFPVAVGGAAVNDGVWHHLALTRAGDRIELFLDGISQEQRRNDLARGALTTDLRALGSERYWIRHFPNGDPHFEGAMDEFCIFGRALEAKEITALAGR
jgi:hypothetical protein